MAGAVVGDIFDAELEKRLIRARKKRILDELEEASVFGTGNLIIMIFSSFIDSISKNQNEHIHLVFNLVPHSSRTAFHYIPKKCIFKKLTEI